MTITGSNLNIVQKPQLGIIITRINKQALSEKVSPDAYFKVKNYTEIKKKCILAYHSLID